MPRRVQHGSDYNDLLSINHFVNHSVWEALRIAPANVLVRMAPAISKGLVASSSKTARNSSTNLSPKPSLRLSYHAAISMTSFSASGLATTVQFSVSFVIGDAPL